MRPSVAIAARPLSVTPCVSVIVPLYNKAAYIKACLDSLCAQTFAHMRIIVVDDGSTDGSAEIVLNYSSYDKRVFLVRQRRAGVSAARNHGLYLALASKSEFIGFVDADDYVSPHMYAELVRQLQAFPS
ncbi:MAG: glycosyltransferase family 2 protein, partial [Coriobacteriia bacterium]|nr:glycosyltransferase family 2 protein [Coriobacteriia bacterium]